MDKVNERRLWRFGSPADTGVANLVSVKIRFLVQVAAVENTFELWCELEHLLEVFGLCVLGGTNIC